MLTLEASDRLKLERCDDWSETGWNSKSAVKENSAIFQAVGVSTRMKPAEVYKGSQRRVLLADLLVYTCV